MTDNIDYIRSDYPVVIMPLFMKHFLMLARNLFYTGLTRVQKLAMYRW